MKKPFVLFVDFGDSFSYNIIQSVVTSGYAIKRVFWTDLTSQMLRISSLIILGPGPGHYQDYGAFLKRIKCFIGKKPILGICLGHQILLGQIMPQGIQRLKMPLHGQTLYLNPPPNSFSLDIHKVFQAQFYNSWAFFDTKEDHQFWKYESMIVGYRGQRTISFQFHPESIGTDSTNCLIRDSLNLLYNRIDD